MDNGGDSYRSIRLVGHPSYSDLLIRDDIGLIEVEKPIEFGDKVKPVALPSEDFNKTDGSAVLSGWGTTSVSIFDFFLYEKAFSLCFNNCDVEK